MANGILLTRHNQEIAQWSPDPFPLERVGSGHETTQSTVIATESWVGPGNEARLVSCPNYIIMGELSEPRLTAENGASSRGHFYGVH